MVARTANPSKRLLWLLALAPVALIALLVWRFAGPDPLSSDELRQRGFWLQHAPAPLRLPDMPDHQDGTFTTDDLRGRWNLVFFGYTHCPDICGPSVALMARALEASRQQNLNLSLQMLMVSVDPARDNPERMAQFLSRFHSEIRGLLPDRHQLHAAAVPLHAVYGKAKQPGLIDHTGNITVIDPDGRYVGHFRPPLAVPTVLGILAELQQAHRTGQL